MSNKTSIILIIKSLVVALIFSLPLTASAISIEPYVGGNYVFAEYKEEGLKDTSLKVAYVRLGASVNEYFSAEVRYGDGLSGDKLTSKEGITFDMDVTKFYGAYIRGGYPVNGYFYPYVIVGHSYMEIKASAFGMDFYDSKEKTSYGFGTDFAITKTLKVNAEYINYIDTGSTGKVLGLSLGIAKSF